MGGGEEFFHFSRGGLTGDFGGELVESLLESWWRVGGARVFARPPVQGLLEGHLAHALGQVALLVAVDAHEAAVLAVTSMAEHYGVSPIVS